MYYHYEEFDYPENCPRDFLFEAESDEKALKRVHPTGESYELSEITKPKVAFDSYIHLDYEYVRTVKEQYNGI